MGATGDIPTPLKAGDVAKRLGIGLSTVYRLAAEGRLRCARLGPKTLRFAPEWVAEYLASVSSGGPKIEGKENSSPINQGG